jgi:HAD superfamily hydrolase (TIGR01662 family)
MGWTRRAPAPPSRIAGSPVLNSQMEITRVYVYAKPVARDETYCWQSGPKPIDWHRHAYSSALFLDRDGVINVDRGYIHRSDEFVFVPGIFELARFWTNELRRLIVVVTNQSGIGRGYFDEGDYEDLTRWMCDRCEAERSLDLIIETGRASRFHRDRHARARAQKNTLQPQWHRQSLHDVMVLNEFVYDPNGKSNSTLFSLSKGTFTFIAGKVAKTGDMKIDTPVATMGIRGTTPHVENFG